MTKNSYLADPVFQKVCEAGEEVRVHVCVYVCV